MAMVISILGFIGFFGCLIWLIVSAIRKVAKKPCLLGMLIAFAMFIGGGIISANSPNVQTAVTPNASKSSSSISPISSTASSEAPVISSEPAPVSSEKSIEEIRKESKSINYKELSRYPDKYKNQSINFTGKVVQSVEDGGMFTLRVAQDENYNNIFLVTYLPTNDARILEDDNITVYGLYNGVQSYTSTLNQQITIPYVTTADIIINK